MALAVLLSGLVAAAGGGEERGKFKLAFFGKEAGHEEYRLEEFEDGTVALFSASRFEVEVQGKRQAFLVDTVLTLDSKYVPLRYASYHRMGADERRSKIEWRKGVAVAGKREVRTSAGFVLDTHVSAQLMLLLRRLEPGKGKVKFFSPASLSDEEAAVEDRGEVLLRGQGREVRAREYRVAVGAVVVNAFLDERRRLVRAVTSVMDGLAVLEGFEGLAPEAPRPEGVEETEVTFPSGMIALAGSVTRPRGTGRCPAVVLLSGSGPHDRDLDVVPGRGLSAPVESRAPHLRLFRTLAHSLSASGVLVLRYDDRGCGKSEGEFGTAKLSDLAADAAAAVAYLRSRPDAGPVGVVGHSEGALIAPLVANRDPAVRAIFLLAGPARPLDEIIMAQAERELRARGVTEETARQMLARQRRVLDEIKRAEGDYLDIDERRTFIGWMREHFNHDVLGHLRKVKGSVAVFQGLKDEQVPPEHAEILLRARPDAEVVRLEGLDHLFSTGSGPADPDRRVDAGFQRILADRVLKYLR